MSTKIVGFVLFSLILAPCFPARAQQPTKILRIGYISGTGNQTNQGLYVEALRQGLHELGYVEGKNFVIEINLTIPQSVLFRADRVIK